jgi:ubiquinone biosynthesis protein COQ9
MPSPNKRPRTTGSRTRTRPVSSVRESVSDIILLAVLAAVPFDGWTDEAYRAGLRKCGVGRGEADLLFPGGVRDLIESFGAMADMKMQAAIDEVPGFARLKVREKITFSVRARLEALTPYREATRRMIYWYAMPLHAPLGLKRIYRTVDLMWRAAGDTSTDFNFYTKRGLLAGVLKATILVWLDDESEGCSKSWAFLDRRIAEVLRVGKSISLAREWNPMEILEMLREKLRA